MSVHEAETWERVFMAGVVIGSLGTLSVLGAVYLVKGLVLRFLRGELSAVAILERRRRRHDDAVLADFCKRHVREETPS